MTSQTISTVEGIFILLVCFMRSLLLLLVFFLYNNIKLLINFLFLLLKMKIKINIISFVQGILLRGQN